MARAIIDGAIRGGIIQSDQIAVADPDAISRAHFEELGCVVVESAAMLPKATYVLLAVKPQIFESVASVVRGRVLYSIMAGVTTDSIAEATGNSTVVRIMPNLPCSVGMGAAGIALGSSACDEDEACCQQCGWQWQSLASRPKLSSAIAFHVEVRGEGICKIGRSPG